MSGSAGLSAAKRRRAEQTLPQQPQQQPIRQSVKETQQQTKPTPRILTPMSILEDHEPFRSFGTNFKCPLGIFITHDHSTSQVVGS